MLSRMVEAVGIGSATRCCARGSWVALVGLLASLACDVDEPGASGPGREPRDAELPLQAPPAVAKVPAPLAGAHCSIDVEGVGTLDMEEDYLPHVIQCENGGANLEALKAQAIAARSVAYYNIETSGSICDGQGCQVYSCGATPAAIHYQAVEETSGLYLNYNDTLTYGFYVAGDSNASPPLCVGVSGSTEGWVTYNEGLSGTNVVQTELGFVHDPGDSGYGQNRGCMSQWSARCLENDNGYDSLGILRFFYGDDIELTQAAGACVLPLPGEESTSGEPPVTTGVGDSTGEPPGSTGGGSEGPAADDGTDPDPPLPGESGNGSEGGSGVATDGPADDVDPALPGAFGEDEDSAGCACRSTAAPSTAAWWLLGVLGVAARRRRRG
jgi:MYXO-CTERM domain-containing protein